MARRFDGVYVRGEEDEFDGDLRGAEFTGTFNGLSFQNRDLSKATLSGKFHKVSFVGAHLDQTKLCGTFVECDFTNTTMRGSKTRGGSAGKPQDGTFVKSPFRGADLSGADLSGGTFRDTDFGGANFASTLLGGAGNGVSLRQANLVGTLNLTEAQLRAASRLRCSKMPSEQLYQGEYALAGDLEDARASKVVLNDSSAMKRFYTECA